MVNNSVETESTFLCPICQSKLYYAIEETVLHLKVINPATGELHKRTKKMRTMNCETRAFLYCVAESCEFMADNEDEDLHGEYFKIFDDINAKDINAFAKEVKC